MVHSLLVASDEKQNSKATENENKFHFNASKIFACFCGKDNIV